MRRVAVITDIHANLPALEAALAAHRRARHRAHLLRRRPGRLRPAPQRGLRADRRARRSRRSTATTTTRSPATSTTAAAPTSRRTTASSASARSTGRWRTPTRRRKDFMRELPFDLRFAVGERRVHLVHGSPRKVNEYLFEDKPARLYERLARGRGRRRARLRPHPQAVDPRVRRRAVRQLRLGRQAQGRRPARRLRRARARTATASRATIERVAYDADAVAARGRRRRACRPSSPTSWCWPPERGSAARRVAVILCAMATAQATPLTGRTAWARNLAAPVRDFLSTETGSAIVLLAATIAALLWANSPWPDSYESVWTTELSFTARRLGADRRPARVGQRRPDDASSSWSSVWRPSASSISASCATASAWRCRSSPRSAA